MMKKINLSLIIPACNDHASLMQNLQKLSTYMQTLNELSNFEIIIVDNGSTDETKNLMAQKVLLDKHLEYVYLPERSFGKAIRAGLLKASCDYVGFISIDIGFGLEHLKQVVQELEQGYELVLGSKLVPSSTYKAAKSRVLFSRITNFLFRKLFSSNVRDTQGTFFIKRTSILQFINKLTSKGAWIQAQIVIQAEKANLRTNEISVTYLAGNRKSSFKYLDALKYILEILYEYIS